MSQREKALERKITREYQKAYREIAQKAEAYFKKFDVKDKEQKELLRQGKITNKDYLDWRKSWLRRTKEYNAMLNDCAEIVTNAGVISSAYVRGEQIDMYATGANWAAYDVCNELNLDLDFTVYDKKNVIRILEENPELLPDMSKKAKANIPKSMRWNKGHIQSEITQGIIQGKAAKDVAKGLARAVGMDKNASIRNARTGLASARSAGTNNRYKEARDRFGIDIKKQWLATLDGKTRHEHRALDGQIRELDEPFVIDGEEIQFPADPTAAPSLVYNCFVGDTSAYTNCDVIRSYSHQYDGDLIEIKTASGVNFTCTPNHPILTLNGWVSAASLHNGDDLLVTRIGNKFNFGRYCNIQHIFPSMKTFHNSFKRNGTIKRNAALRVNFHGDVPTSEVEIVTQKRFLSNDGYSSFCESVKKFLLKLSDKTLLCKCTFMKHFGSVWLSTLCGVGGRSKFLSILKGRLRHSEIHSLRPIALLDSGHVQAVTDNVSGNLEIISDCLDGFSGIVFADNIVNVNISSRCTHVYNLQTENGYYFVNSIISQKNKKYNDIVAISHNCRCTLTNVIGKYNNNANYDFLGDVSYSQWVKGGR